MSMWSEQFEIIKEIISKRIGKNASRVAIASALDVSRGKVQAWDTGQRPSADDLESIARKLNLNPIWLLMGEGTPSAELEPASPPPPTQDLGPIAEAVSVVEKAMLGVDELSVIKAAVAKLETMYASKAARSGGYGKQLEVRESSLMHEPEGFPYGDSCSIDKGCKTKPRENAQAKD